MEKLEDKQQVHTFLCALIAGGSVTCNGEALSAVEIRALEYLEDKDVCVRAAPPKVDEMKVDCPRCLGKKKTVDDMERAIDKKRDPKKARCKHCRGKGWFKQGLDANDAAGRFRLNKEKEDLAKRLLIHFDREIRRHLETGKRKRVDPHSIEVS